MLARQARETYKTAYKTSCTVYFVSQYITLHFATIISKRFPFVTFHHLFRSVLFPLGDLRGRPFARCSRTHRNQRISSLNLSACSFGSWETSRCLYFVNQYCSGNQVVWKFESHRMLRLSGGLHAEISVCHIYHASQPAHFVR